LALPAAGLPGSREGNVCATTASHFRVTSTVIASASPGMAAKRTDAHATVAGLIRVIIESPPVQRLLFWHNFGQQKAYADVAME
jgi:hypothetical protein